MPGFITSGIVLLGLVGSVFYFGLLPRTSQGLPLGIKPFAERTTPTRKLSQQISDDAENPGPNHCSSGYHLKTDRNGRGVCDDVNEYERLEGITCEPDGECRKTIGSYTCDCKAGFMLDSTGTTCVDENECNIDDKTKVCGGENGVCRNTIGSYECVCDEGYESSSDDDGEPTCVDVDECKLFEETELCEGENDVCRNTIGSYECVRDKGYESRFDDDGKLRCTDKNDCDYKKVFSYSNPTICRNAPMPYNCFYTRGYENYNRIHCIDANECNIDDKTTKVSEGVNDVCRNTIGSDECVCDEGYESRSDDDGEPTCVDVNECERLAGITCMPDGECRNTIGSYTCDCKAGFLLDSTGTTCVEPIKLSTGELLQKILAP